VRQRTGNRGLNAAPRGVGMTDVPAVTMEALIERAGQLTSDEIFALDRAFRGTPGIGRAWSWAYGGQVMHANNVGLDAVWDAVARLGDAMDGGRAAAWSSARRHEVAGRDHPERAELERTWTSVRMNPTPLLEHGPREGDGPRPPTRPSLRPWTTRPPAP